MIVPLFLLVVLGESHITPVSRIPIPRDIFIVESLSAAKDGSFVMLDANSFLLLKIEADGTVIKSGKRGQGPGELYNPWAVTVAEGRVYVTDYQMIHVFNLVDLSFIERIKTSNNAMAISVRGNEIYLATSTYPTDGYGIQVLDLSGKDLRHFYEHRAADAPAEMQIPHFAVGSEGHFYLLHHQEYRIDILDRQGKEVLKLPVAVSPKYRPVTSLAKLEKKIGQSMASWNRWKTEWSVSSGIAIVKDRYLWLCFEELQDDLRTKRYFVDVYDLTTGTKMLSWQEMPGRLYDGGQLAYFVQDVGGITEGEYDLEIVGYSVE